MGERRFHVPARRHRLSAKTALKTAGVDWASHINVVRITCAPCAFRIAEELPRQVEALVGRNSGLRIATRPERSKPSAVSSESRRLSSASSSCSGMASKPTRA